MKLVVADRLSGQLLDEEVYGADAIRAVYGNSWWSAILRHLVRYPFVSFLYGWIQNRRWTRRKIRPFIKRFGVDESEFVDSVESFSSFNDFFTRRLKPEVRPIAEADAIVPADGRYRVFPNLGQADGFVVKGKVFSLKDLLGDDSVAAQYQGGAMVMARLAPVDYHRFHFCADGEVGAPDLVNGYLYSVNPYAVKQNIEIFVQNKRVISTLKTKQFGEIITIAVGATNVGNIVHNHPEGGWVNKGDEKGYFAFGGSALILLFTPNSIVFEQDLISSSVKGMEVRCLMGQPLGHAVRNLG